jgi:hypothetical protein
MGEAMQAPAITTHTMNTASPDIAVAATMVAITVAITAKPQSRPGSARLPCGRAPNQPSRLVKPRPPKSTHPRRRNPFIFRSLTPDL